MSKEEVLNLCLELDYGSFLAFVVIDVVFQVFLVAFDQEKFVVL